MKTDVSITIESSDGPADDSQAPAAGHGLEIFSGVTTVGQPRIFASIFQEVVFVVAIAASQLLEEYLLTGFMPLAVCVPGKTSTTWAANVPPLVVSAFLLTFGRLIDIHGGFPVFVGGMLWTTIWTTVSGFATSAPLFIFCRAMQGLGAAAYLPAGLALFGVTYTAGPRKNIVFSIYAAMAPLGSFLGLLVASLGQPCSSLGWYFWVAAMVASVSLLLLALSVPGPRIRSESTRAEMDWLGSFLIAAALIVLVFVLTNGAHAPQGWRTPYIVAVGIVAALLLVLAAYVEGWVANHPLISFSVFRIKQVRPLILALLFSYGTTGIYMLYATT
jgi:MFS family permease